MAQQPNPEIAPQHLPPPGAEPAPARRPPRRPGLILEPSDKPSGPGYGNPGPDTGWALRILARADLPERDPRLMAVLAALMAARAAHYGRAPTAEDLEVALIVAGFGRHPSEDLDQRRRHWMETVSHEKAPGMTAVAEAGDILFQDPAHADLLVRT